MVYQQNEQSRARFGGSFKYLQRGLRKICALGSSIPEKFDFPEKGVVHVSYAVWAPREGVEERVQEK